MNFTKLFCCVICSFLLAHIYPQTDTTEPSRHTETAPETSNNTVMQKQFQTFHWKPLERASKYSVTIEQKNAENQWIYVETQETKETRAETLLYPGTYRMSISAYNVLNKKASTSPWIEFVILDETEPYLLPDTFSASDDGASDTISFELRRTASTEPYELHVKGRNIFFPDTVFSLVPLDTPPKNAAHSTQLITKRPEVILSVKSRDREQNQVTVSVPWEQLYTGYYRLEVRNLGGETDSIPVFVQPERSPSFSGERLRYDRRYKIHTAELVRDSDPALLTITGTDFQSDTVYMLEPVTGTAYPFASTRERSAITVQPESYTATDGSKITLTFPVDTTLLETGQYRLTAQSPRLEKGLIDILFKILSPPDMTPFIKKVKTSYSKKNATVTFTVTGKNLVAAENAAESDTDAVLVSPVDKNGSNLRIPLTVTKVNSNGKKVVCTAGSAALQSGMYALLLETPAGSNIAYIELKENFDVKLCDLTAEVAAEHFLRSEEKEPEPEPAEDIQLDENPADSTFAAPSAYSADWLLSLGGGALFDLNRGTGGMASVDILVSLKKNPAWFLSFSIYCGSTGDNNVIIDEFFQLGRKFHRTDNLSLAVAAGCGIEAEKILSVVVEDYVPFFTIPLSAGIDFGKHFVLKYTVTMCLGKTVYATDIVTAAYVWRFPRKQKTGE